MQVRATPDAIATVREMLGETHHIEESAPRIPISQPRFAGR